MKPLKTRSIVEQVAEHLRDEVMRGHFTEEMPGIKGLAAELETNHKTVESALRLLEIEGLLVPQGAGRRRRIVLPNGHKPRSLRVAILIYDPLAQTSGYIIELQHLLQEAGFTAFFTKKSLQELQMNVNGVARLVRQTKAEAWVVVGGSSDVLEWFKEQGIHVFALFGRRRDLPIAGAGPDKSRAIREVVQRLVALGHRRIVLVVKSERRLPEPGLLEQAFLEELESHGISTSSYNLPDWDESPEGLQRLIDSLFQITPPTAFLLDEAYIFNAAKHHLCQSGIRSPEDVSLICTDPDPIFAWCRPSIAHIRWESGPVLRRIIRWAENVATGKKDLRQKITEAEFVDGGTVGRTKS